MIWHDGKLSEGREITLDASDRGLLLADGLFETVAVFDGVPFRLAAHWDRMAAAARTIGLPLDRTRLDEAAAALIATSAGGHAVLRVTVTRGAGPRGLAPAPDVTPTVIAGLAPWRPDMAFRSIALATSTVTRNSGSPTSGFKSLAYLDNVLALRDALGRGANDALLMNQRGAVACSSAANLFIVRGAELATPPLADGVLPGIMRNLLLEAAPQMGLAPREISLSLDEVRAADAAFLTNSVRLVDAVNRIDDVHLVSDRSPVGFLLIRTVAAVIESETGFAFAVPAWRRSESA